MRAAWMVLSLAAAAASVSVEECRSLLSGPWTGIPVPSGLRLYTQGYFRPPLDGRREPVYQPFATLYWDAPTWQGAEMHFNVHCVLKSNTTTNVTNKVTDHTSSVADPQVTHIDLKKIYGKEKYTNIQPKQVLQCRVRGQNALSVVESGPWSDWAATSIGPQSSWRPPPLVTLTFRDLNATAPRYWAAVLDANTQTLTQLFERRNPVLMELADGKSSSYAKWDQLQARFINFAPRTEAQAVEESAKAEVKEMADLGLRRLNGSEMQADGPGADAVQLPLVDDEDVIPHGPLVDSVELLDIQQRFHPRMVNSPRFRSHAYTSDWLNGHAYVAVPGDRNNSIVAAWEYSAHKLWETPPGMRVESLVFNPYGNELFALIADAALVSGPRRAVHRIPLFNWKPPGVTHGKRLFRQYTGRDCGCVDAEAEDVTAMALDLRRLLRSGGVLDGTRPDLILATAKGNLYSANLTVLAKESGICECKLIAHLTPEGKPSVDLLQPLNPSKLGALTTLAVSSEHVFYAYARGPMFMANLKDLDKATKESRDVTVFKDLVFNFENLQLTPDRIYDIELNSRSWKPFPLNATCLAVPSRRPRAEVQHVAPDSIQIKVVFPLESGNGPECSVFPPPAVYGHVFIRNINDIPASELAIQASHGKKGGGWGKPSEFSDWRSIVIHNLNSSTTYQLYILLRNADGSSRPSQILQFTTNMSRLLHLVIICVVALLGILVVTGFTIFSAFVMRRYRGMRRKEWWLKWLVANFESESGREEGGGDGLGGIAKLPIIPAADITDTGQRLGEGAFGTCSVALIKEPNTTQQTRVAMKQLNRHLRGPATAGPRPEEEMERVEYAFFCEADAMQRLQTPAPCANVVKLIGISVDREMPCLLIELMKTDVKSLLSALSKGHSRYTLSEEDAVRLAIDVAAGMGYMHSRSWIHRDIRAVNVFLTSSNPLDWVAKLGDLGLSRDLRKLRMAKREYPIRGDDLVPCAWGAPETLARPTPVYDFKSDVWSFGVFCWEMATLGAHPYAGLKPAKIIDAVVKRRGNPGRPARLPKLYDLAMGPCWEYDQDDRPSAAMLLDSLTDSLAEEPVPAHRGPFNLDVDEEVTPAVWVPQSASNSNHTDSTCLTETTQDLDSLAQRNSHTYRGGASLLSRASVEMQPLNSNAGVYLDHAAMDFDVPPFPVAAPPRPDNYTSIPLNSDMYLHHGNIGAADTGYLSHGEDLVLREPPPKPVPYLSSWRRGSGGESAEAFLRGSDSSPRLVDSGYVGEGPSELCVLDRNSAQLSAAAATTDSDGTLTDDPESASYFTSFFKKKSRSLKDLGLHSEYIDG